MDKLDQVLALVQGMAQDLTELKTDVATLKTDVATLKSDVATLKTDVATLKTEMTGVQKRLSALESGLHENTAICRALEERADITSARMKSLSDAVKGLQGQLAHVQGDLAFAQQDIAARSEEQVELAGRYAWLKGEVDDLRLRQIRLEDEVRRLKDEAAARREAKEPLAATA